MSLSAASPAQEIVPQAQDALASAAEAGVVLPPAIKDGVIPPHDLSEYQKTPLVLAPYTGPAPVAVCQQTPRLPGSGQMTQS